MLIGIIYDLLHGILFIMWNTDRVSDEDFYNSQAKGFKQSNHAPIKLLSGRQVSFCNTIFEISYAPSKKWIRMSCPCQSICSF